MAPILCVGVVLLSRWWTRSNYLFGWDSVNFALAMDRWDLSIHQPHPPGYIAYVALARVARWLGADQNLSLQLVSMGATGLALWVWWRLARRVGVSRAAAVGGAGLLATSPLLWLYSSVAEVYALDMLATLVVVSAATDDEATRHVARTKLALAFLFAALVRLPTALLLLPVAAAHRRDAWGRLMVAAVVVAATVLTLAVLDPSFTGALAGHFAFTTSATRLFDGPADPLETLNRNVRDVFRAVLMSGAGISVLLPFSLWQAWGRQPLAPRLLAAWLLPMLSVFTLVHFGKQGYLLPLLPLACLYVAASLSARVRHAVPILAVATAVQVLQFFAASPPSAQAMGQGRRYAEKTLMQKMATELEPIAFATAGAIAREDARVSTFVDRMAEDCRDTRIVVFHSGGAIDWRRAMFYVPSAISISYDIASRPMIVAHHRGVRTITASEHMTSGCEALWVGDTPPPETLPSAYTAYQSRLIALDDTVEGAETFDLTPVTQEVGTVSGTAMPASTDTRENTVFVRFSSNASIQVVDQADAPNTFSYLVPKLANASIMVAAREGPYDGPTGLAHADGLDPGDSAVVLDIPAPAEPLSPVGGSADSVTKDTTFTFRASPDSKGAFVVWMENTSFQQTLYIVTSKTSFKIPVVAGGIFELDAAQTFRWRVETHGSFASVDEMTGASGFMDAFSFNWSTPMVPKQVSGSFTMSGAYGFTTAP
jgi:hypothetical protein